MSGAPLPNNVSQGDQHVMKMLASCYFALKCPASHKRGFVIFPCCTQFTFPSTYLLNNLREHDLGPKCWCDFSLLSLLPNIEKSTKIFPLFLF